MSVRRLASIASALLVAGIAALASYTHMRGLALRYGQDPLIATLLPVSVDGMMVVATVALGDGRRHRWSAWLAFWTGVAASVVANVLAAQPLLIARCISAWPAVAFLLVVEVITRGGRLRLPAPAQDGRPKGVAPIPPLSGPQVVTSPGSSAPERAAERSASDGPALSSATVPAGAWVDSGDHSGTHAAAGPSSGPAATSVVSGSVPDPAGTARAPQPRTTAAARARSSRPSTRRKPPEPAPDVSDLVPAGRAVRDRLAGQGRAMTRNELVAGLRADGQRVSSRRATALYAALNHEPHPAPARPA